MQITILRGQLIKARKKRVGNPSARNEKGQFPKKEGIGEKANPYGTAGVIAQELGVSHGAIEKAENFVDGLDAAEAVVPGFKDAVLTGEVKAQKQEVAAMRKQTPDEIKKSVQSMKEP